MTEKRCTLQAFLFCASNIMLCSLVTTSISSSSLYRTSIQNRRYRKLHIVCVVVRGCRRLVADFGIDDHCKSAFRTVSIKESLLPPLLLTLCMFPNPSSHQLTLQRTKRHHEFYP
ncbi:hypothetical protein BDZ97DRAFT_1819188, partial [Flammula alnicola]